MTVYVVTSPDFVIIRVYKFLSSAQQFVDYTEARAPIKLSISARPLLD